MNLGVKKVIFVLNFNEMFVYLRTIKIDENE